MVRMHGVLHQLNKLDINKSPGVGIIHFGVSRSVRVKQWNMESKCRAYHLQSYPYARILEDGQHD